MTAREMLEGLGAPELLEAFTPRWDEAQAALLPSRYAAERLAPAAVAEARQASHLADALEPPLLAMASRVADSPALLALAAYAHWRLFLDEEGPTQSSWPSLESRLGNDAALFYLLVAIGFPSEFCRRHAANGVPMAVLRETCRQIDCYADNYRVATGRPGIFVGQLSWLHYYLPPRQYFRIGRLEFALGTMQLRFRAYRHKGGHGDEMAIFPEAGLLCRADGNACFSGIPRPDDSWKTILWEGDGWVEGNPVASDGRVGRTTSHLDLREWECALRPGDPTLEIHIPSGGGMKPELVRDSIRRAIEFFDRHIPGGRDVKAVFSCSWIYSNQLPDILPPESNILAFQRMLHLLPVSSSPDSGTWFIFYRNGPYGEGVRDLPRDTSLRRAFAEWIERNGDTFRLGGMLLLRDEAERL